MAATLPMLSPDDTAQREISLSRLLVLYIATGLVFMLFPGTFLGVWNLLTISSRQEPASISAAWIQAHGHAQIFGWIGTFILGIGFYSIPKLRRLNRFALSAPRIAWLLWTAGVTARWFAGVYQWQWRVLLPLSAAMELSAFLIFYRCVSGHRPEAAGGRPKLGEWVWVVLAGTVGFLLALVLNFASATYVAVAASSPELPPGFDQRFLALQTWGFLVPTVWGFSAKWLPVFLGLQPTRGRMLLWAVAVNSAGVLAALAGWTVVSALLVTAGIAVAIHALRLFERTGQPAKINGVHSSFPAFVRVAYLWAAIAALAGIWASAAPDPHGIWGASRHALTVGFLATMVFAVGQRVLPAFSGMRLLFSPRLMFACLALLSAGCFLRVSSEILAYQGFLRSAWTWLPISAVIEMTAVSLFAVNLLTTFARSRRAEPA